jgi:hypothetical protein
MTVDHGLPGLLMAVFSVVKTRLSYCVHSADTAQHIPLLVTENSVNRRRQN